MEYFENSDTSSMVWTEIYRPKKISEIIGNDKAVKSIVAWLTGFEENKRKTKQKKKKKIRVKITDDQETPDDVADPDGLAEGDEIYTAYTNVRTSKANQPKSCLLLTGDHGTGKSCIVHAILQSMGYVVQVINFGRIKTNKNIAEVIENIMNSSDILTMIEGKKNAKIAIVIDELEAVTSSTGKNCIISLLKNNEENWLCPTIFISNNQHNKLLSDIKKNSHNVKLWPPFPSELLTLFRRIVIEEKINVAGFAGGNYKVAYYIIDHSQKDFRRLIMTLQDLKYAYGHTTITMTMVDEYCKLSKKKDEDFDLFKATDFILQRYNGIEDCIRYYETEKVLLPLMVHQNYIDVINHKCGNVDDRFRLAEDISDVLSEGDVIENYIYGDQNWDINEVHGYYTCTAPSYLLHSTLQPDDSIRLAFPADLNKASIGKINRKNIVNAGKCFKNKNIHDYIYINLIIRNLISEGRMDDCVRLLEGYDVKLANIESLLKVDKIKSSKTNLTSKQKKELSSFLTE